MAETRAQVPGGASAPASRLTDASTRLPTLTSLRALAALAVFTRHASEAFFPDGHASPLTRQGATGVSFFFILSGFVLAWSAQPGDTAGRFYRRRLARIYPAYLLVLVLTQVVVGARHGLSPAPLLANGALVQSWVPNSSVYFSSDMGAWSLGCEMFFYLLFPLLLPALQTLTSRRRWQLAGLAGAFEVGMALVTHSPQQAGGLGLWLVYVLPVTRLGEFVIGIVIALSIRSGLRVRIRLNQALALAGAAYLAAGFVPVYLMWVAVTLVPFALLVAAAATCDLEGRPSWLRHRWLVRAGHWSYAFYLVHISVITVVHHLAGGRVGGPSALAQMMTALVLSAAAAGVVFVLVERPAERRLRDGLRRVTRVPSIDQGADPAPVTEQVPYGTSSRNRITARLRPARLRPARLRPVPVGASAPSRGGE